METNLAFLKCIKKFHSQVFIVEKLREQRYNGALDDQVTIGWDSRDSVLAPE